MRSRYFLGFGGLLVLVFFWFPWVSLQISPQLPGWSGFIASIFVNVPILRFSGLELMIGPTVTLPIIGAIQVAPASPSLGLVLLAGLAAVACTFCADDHRAAFLLRILTLVSGLVSVPLIWLKSDAFRLPPPINLLVPLSVEPAFWATMIGLGLAMATALLLLVRGRAEYSGDSEYTEIPRRPSPLPGPRPVVTSVARRDRREPRRAPGLVPPSRGTVSPVSARSSTSPPPPSTGGPSAPSGGQRRYPAPPPIDRISPRGRSSR